MRVVNSSWKPAVDRGERVQRARVKMDGVVLFDGEQNIYDTSSYDVTVEVNSNGGSTWACAFTGTILGFERMPGAN